MDGKRTQSLLEKNHRHQPSHDHEDSFKLVPPDGGWGWMVTLGTLLITTLMPVMFNCFSVLFAEYLLGAGCSSTTVAWIFNLHTFLFAAGGLLVRPLTEEFGWRPVALTGSALAAAGVMMSAFAPSPSFLFFSISLLTGLSSGLVTKQSFSILPHFFKRRLGLANGIMTSGLSLGQILLPPLTRYLLISYGFMGATLVVGALLLHACVGASLYQPYEWHQKKVRLEEELQKETTAFSSEANAVGSPDLTSDMVCSNSEASFFVDAVEGEPEGGRIVMERLLGRRGDRNGSCSSSPSICSSTGNISSFGVHSFGALPVEDESKEDLEAKKQRDILLVRVVRSLIRDLGAVKSLRVWILCLANSMCVIAYSNFLMMVPFVMLEAGFSLSASAWCISLSAGCSLVTRILVSAITDWPVVNKRLLYVSGFALIAFSIFAFSFVSSIEWLTLVMVLHGIGVGANTSIMSIIIIDVMGVEHLSTIVGIAGMYSATGFITIGPLIGFIRDVTGSYAITINVTGSLLLVSLAGWLFMGLAEKVDERRKTMTKALRNT